MNAPSPRRAQRPGVGSESFVSFTSRGLVSGHSVGEAWGRRGSDFEVMSFVFTLHIYNAQPVPGTAVTAL